MKNFGDLMERIERIELENQEMGDLLNKGKSNSACSKASTQSESGSAYESNNLQKTLNERKIFSFNTH